MHITDRSNSELLKPGLIKTIVDFVIDSIANKRPLKNLTVIDPVSKVAPRIIPAYSMHGEGVAKVLNDIWIEEPVVFLQTRKTTAILFNFLLLLLNKRQLL